MNYIDETLTRRLQAWLEAEDAYADNIEEGAELLLKFTRNRFLYTQALARPEKMAGKVAYELRKFLRLQLDGVTTDAVAKMQPAVTKAAEEVLGKPRLGRRADHDRLPADIQALWEANGQRWHKIRQAYNSLQQLIADGAMPCDLYETLKILDELDTAYRADMERYDGAVALEEGKTGADALGTVAEVRSRGRKKKTKEITP